MRTLKLLLLLVVALALIVLGVANMAPVDLHLVPPQVGGPETTLEQVPLTAILFGAVAVGVVVGFLLEWLREAKYRRLAAEKKREAGRLRSELGRLNARADDDADLPDLPAR